MQRPAQPEATVVIDFLRGLGMEVAERPLLRDPFLPGIEIVAGGLVVDWARSPYPGDLLHEAGHLALLTPDERRKATSRLVTDGGYEMGAIAWSYAACLELGLPVELLFHDEGYKGGAQALRDNFANRRFIGVPMLVWLGLATNDPPERGGYPRMQRWLAS